jgi:predicted dehydrogenase
MADPVIAIVGQGRMARAHARAWAGLGQPIGYVCAPAPQRPLEHAPAARFATDLGVVLADPAVGIVSVCTPTPSHADIAIRSLAAGKNVLLEKPIALSLVDAVRIGKAAQRSPGLLMVAHVVRFFPGYRRLREQADAGVVGRVLSVRARRLSAPGEQRPWMLDESRSGGVLVDFAIHDFDQVNLHLGTAVAVNATRVQASGPIETTVEYRDGGIGQVLTYLSLPPGTPFTSSLELVGTGGLAQYHFSEVSPTVLAGEDPYLLQAEYFLNCVRSGEPPRLCPPEAAIAALRVALAARASLAAGTPIRLPSPHKPISRRN